MMLKRYSAKCSLDLREKFDHSKEDYCKASIHLFHWQMLLALFPWAWSRDLSLRSPCAAEPNMEHRDKWQAVNGQTSNARRLDTTEKRHEVMGPWDSLLEITESPRAWEPFSGRTGMWRKVPEEPGVEAAQWTDGCFSLKWFVLGSKQGIAEERKV